MRKMKANICKETLEMAEFFMSHDIMSVKIAEEMLGIPKSTIHYRLTHVLPDIDFNQYVQVHDKLRRNLRTPRGIFLEKRKNIKDSVLK